MDENVQRRRVTLEDVAKLAKVSTSAVSRTFTDGASVSKKTRTKVLKAADHLGFRPNALARSLMTGRSALIGLVSNAFINPFIMNILSAFTIELQKRRLRPLVFNLAGDYSIRETITLMQQYQLDGVLVASSTLDPNFTESVAAAGIPVVLAFGAARASSGVSAAYVDNFEGGRLVGEAFLKRGYSRIGFIGGGEAVSTTRDRLLGLRSILAEMRAREPTVIYAGRYDQATGFEMCKRLIAKAPDLDAIFCADDLIGIGAVDALRELGRAIPATGVIGFNDIQMANWPAYRLSTVRAHTDEVVQCAIEMLEAQIENPTRPAEKRIISCEFVPRTTVHPLPAK